MIVKDFAGWHSRKLAVDRLESIRYFYEREIWWTVVGHNVGSEEDGKGQNFARPVLVLRKFNQSLFYGLPLSTTNNTGQYYFPLTVRSVSNKVLLSQLRAYDARRLINKLAVVSEDEHREIQDQLMDIIKPPLSQG